MVLNWSLLPFINLLCYAYKRSLILQTLLRIILYADTGYLVTGSKHKTIDFKTVNPFIQFLCLDICHYRYTIR